MKIKLNGGKSVEASRNDSILDALEREGIFLTSSCGGKGVCGKCKIKILSGDARVESTIKLSHEEISKGYALACKSFPLTDIAIEIPRESVLTVEGKVVTARSKELKQLLEISDAQIDPLTKRQILKLPPPTLDDNISDLERLKRALNSQGPSCLRIPFRVLKNLSRALRDGNWEITLVSLMSEDCNEITNVFPGDRKDRQFGIAIDIGTTTIVVFLIDLITGELIDAASTYNSQIRYGDDVITRIVNATEKGQLREIHEAVISDINILSTLLLKNHKIDINDVDCIVVAGNTTMSHLFLGLNPASIREEPYIPTANTFPISHAGELGIKLNPNIPVYTFPCVASYMGGDIVAGILASGIHKSKDLCIFIDIGTNGEIVIGNSEWLISAACSAGPCFEGSGIKHGMRATDGAIEDVRINRETLDVEIKVIGENAAPMGICGSGMIDAVAEMFLTGILDQKGKLVKGITDRVRDGEDGPEFVIHYGETRDIVLTEPDIENIIRAKAAIYAGFTTLLKEVGFTFDDVSKIYIAGGFGKFLDYHKAMILGMLPEIPEDKFEYLGNTSIKGAYLCTLSQRLRAEAEEIAKKMTYVELSVSRSFMDEYVSGLFIPHTNINDFPTVKALKEESSF